MIKKILKYTKNLTLLSIGLVGIYLFNLFFMKPYSIDHFLGKELVIGLVDSPKSKDNVLSKNAFSTLRMFLTKNVLVFFATVSFLGILLLNFF